MGICSSHKSIVTAAMMTCALTSLSTVQADEYRQISRDFVEISAAPKCDSHCKTTLRSEAKSANEWFELAMNLKIADNFSSARFSFRQVIAKADTLDEMMLIPSALVELGNMSFANNELSVAEDYFQRATKAAAQCDDIEKGAVAFIDLGLVYRKMGEKLDARDMFRNSLRLTRGHDEFKVLRVNAMFQYGRILKEQNNKVWAKKALLKAKNLSKKYAFKRLLKASYHELESLEGDREHYTRTSHVVKRGLQKSAYVVKKAPKAVVQKVARKKIFSKPSIKSVAAKGWVMRDQDMAASYDRLGVSHMERRQYDMASEMFRKSIFLNKQLGNKVAQAKSYHNIAKIYTKLGDHKNSCVNFWQARELMSKSNKQGAVKGLTTALKNNNCLFQQAALDMK